MRCCVAILFYVLPLFSFGNQVDTGQSIPQKIESIKRGIQIQEEGSILAPTQLAEKYLEIGILYNNINDHENSLQCFIHAIRHTEKDSEKDLIYWKAHLNVGKLYTKLEDFDNSFTYLYKCKNSLHGNNIEQGKLLIQSLIELGIVHGLRNNLDSSLYYFNNATVINRSLDEEDVVLEGRLLNNIAGIYLKQRELDSAQSKYERAFLLFAGIKNNRGMGITSSNLASVQAERENHEEAIKLYLKAITYLKEENDVRGLTKAYEYLSIMYEKTNDLNDALYYQKLFNKTQKQLTNTTTLSKISDIKNQYEVEKIEKELRLLESEKELQEIQQYIIYSGFAILAIIGLLVFRSLRISVNNSKLKQEVLAHEKKRLESELEYKNKELEGFALRIVEKNEFLSKLREELKRVKSKGDDQKVKELSFSIQNNLLIDKDRQEFDAQLENIHQSFLHKLNQQFPDLTKNENRLCSLLVIGLSSKDIAAIMNISPDSVKKSRYRLRKKLNLETDQDITQFLKETV